MNATSHTASAPLQGDIWKENDVRFTRYVRVERVGTGRRCVAIRTVMLVNDRWLDAPRSRLSYADIERFGKKSASGYSLHHRTDEDVSK